MPDEVKLLPCPVPWCGREDPHYMTWIYQGGHIIHCLHCHVSGPIKDTKAEAIAAWNTRAIEATRPADMEVRDAE